MRFETLRDGCLNRQHQVPFLLLFNSTEIRTDDRHVHIKGWTDRSCNGTLLSSSDSLFGECNRIPMNNDGMKWRIYPR